MGIFDRFKEPVQKPDPEPVQNSDLLLELLSLCYQIAYLMLPPLVFSEPERTIGQFIDDPALAGPYFYCKAVVGLKIQAVQEHALAFHTHWGELSADKNYYILAYPVPPPLDPRQWPQVLAPFFTAIIQEPASGKVSYYVLGQRPVLEAHPEPGTTFRTVTPDGQNCNLGPGPLPELAAFVEFLKQKLAPTET